MALTCPNIVYPCTASVDGSRYTKFPTPNGNPALVSAALTAYGWGQTANSGGTITGPAPLAVFFDATATEHGDNSIDPFRDLGYHFDFGYATPSTPGTWTHSGEPKGNQIGGPLAAHVFETAGTYTVTVRAQDGSASTSDKSLTVVVLNPDTVYSGAATVLVSTDGSTDGSYPSAAIHNTTSSGWPTFASDKRYLFKAGQDFTSFGNKNLNSLNRVQFGSFGAGAKPKFAQLRVERRTSGELQATYGQIVLNNLEMTVISECPSPVTDVLLYRCTAPGWYMGTLVESQQGAAAVQTGWFFPRGVVHYECTYDAAAGESVFGECERSAILGCTVTSATLQEIRIQSFHKLFIGHTQAYNGTAAGNYEELSLRAMGVLDRASNTDVGDWSSRYAVVADCIIGDATDTNPQQATTVKPSSSSFSQGIEDVLFERNTYVDAAVKTRDLVAEARRVSTRDQTMPNLMGGATSHALTPAEWMGPYYSDQLTAALDGVHYFTSPPTITPSKAGT